MPCRYLLDTNIASYVIKGTFPAARRRLVRHPMAEIAVSSVTEGELCYAVRGNWKLRVCGPSSKNFSCG